MMNRLKNIIKKDIIKILSYRTFKRKKFDGSYVSKSDIYIQNIIKKFISNKFKKESYLLVSEENTENKKINYDIYENIIILDPIDETENFVSGLPIWGISICWFYKNQHKESLIYLPELDLEIQKKYLSKKFKSRIIGLSSSNNKILKSYKDLNEVRITGCCIYNIYNVLNGIFESYTNKKANVWDFIAGFNIAYENQIPVKVDGKKYNGEILQSNKKYNIEIKYKSNFNFR